MMLKFVQKRIIYNETSVFKIKTQKGSKKELNFFKLISDSYMIIKQLYVSILLRLLLYIYNIILLFYFLEDRNGNKN